MLCGVQPHAGVSVNYKSFVAPKKCRMYEVGRGLPSNPRRRAVMTAKDDKRGVVETEVIQYVDNPL